MMKKNYRVHSVNFLNISMEVNALANIQTKRRTIFTIEINCSRSIGIDFLDHHIQIFVGDFVVQFLQDFT